MLRAYSIGKLCGIRLDVHASWLPIYVLVTVTIANLTALSSLGAAAYAFGAVAALVLFAMVVLHELAHALAARRFGVQTSAISLFLFGGVATLEEEPPGPLADVVVAVAGPAASAALALVAFGALQVAGRVLPAAQAGLVVEMLAYLTFVNAVLATFNLIPAYPMDGGRVLRAIFWRLRGDRDRATATAALVGLGFGICFAAGGIIAAVATRTWEFGWYVVVAVYLVRTSWSQYRALRRRGPAEGYFAPVAAGF